MKLPTFAFLLCTFFALSGCATLPDVATGPLFIAEGVQQSIDRHQERKEADALAKTSDLRVPTSAFPKSPASF